MYLMIGDQWNIQKGHFWEVIGLWELYLTNELILSRTHNLKVVLADRHENVEARWEK